MKLLAYRLAARPELASLAVLQTAVHVSIVALDLAWPELHGDPPFSREPLAALEVIQLAQALSLALRRYRFALAIRDRRHGIDF